MTNIEPVLDPGELGKSGQVMLRNQTALDRAIEALENKFGDSPAILYADAASGDDTNTGINSSAPKKSIEGVMDSLPDIIDRIINITLAAGTYTIPADYTFGKIFVGPGGVYFRGDGTFTVIDDNSGSDYDVVSFSGRTITVSGTPFTVDEHHGYVVEVTAGTGLGQSELVFSNAANTITVSRNLSTSLDATSKVRIVRPASTLALAGAMYTAPLSPTDKTLAAPEGINYLFENLSFDGGLAYEHLAGTVLIAGCVMTNGTSKAFLSYAAVQGIGSISRTESGGFKLARGTGCPGKAVFFQEGASASVSGLVCAGFELLSSFLVAIVSIRAAYVVIQHSMPLALTTGFIPFGTQEDSVIGGLGNTTRPCLLVRDSVLSAHIATLDGGTVGLELTEGADVTLSNAVGGGTNNSVAGVKMGAHCRLKWQAATAPTLTNSADNNEITFGFPETTEDATWAAGSTVETTKTLAVLEAV